MRAKKMTTAVAAAAVMVLRSGFSPAPTGQYLARKYKEFRSVLDLTRGHISCSTYCTGYFAPSRFEAPEGSSLEVVNLSGAVFALCQG